MSRRRKGANEEHGGQRSMGGYIRRERKVQIIDDEDDDIEEIHAREFPETSSSSRSVRLTRRQLRQTEQTSQLSGTSDEDWGSLQEALRMSKLEAEKQEERRKMCGNVQDVMKLQVEIEPMECSSSPRGVITWPKRESTDDRIEREDSPELFSTPPEDQDEQSNTKTTRKVDSEEEFPESPTLPVTSRSPEVELKDQDGKENIKQEAAPAASFFRKVSDLTRKKFRLRRTREDQSKEEQRKDKTELKFVKSDDENQAPATKNSKISTETPRDWVGVKRKLKVNKDDDEATDDEDMGQVVTGNRKRKKLPELSDDSDTCEPEVDRKASKRLSKRLDDPPPKRNAGSSSDQEPALGDAGEQRTLVRSLRLTRRYKNPRRRPTTIKEARRANLYFAPPGCDLPTYTMVIIRMFERYRIRLHVAQSKVKTRIPWGATIKPGVRQGDTLDSRASTGTTRGTGRTAAGGDKGTAVVKGTPRTSTATEVKTHSETLTPDRKRTLRSSHPVKLGSTTNTRGARISQPLKVDSESEDEPDLKSYLDEISQPSVKKLYKKQPARIATKDEGKLAAEFGANVGGVKSSMFDTSSDNTLHIDETSKENSCKTDSTTHTVPKKEVSGNTGDVSLDDHTSKDEVQLMDCETETIRPPKRRSVLRVLENDSTEDESDESQPSFSFRLAAEEKSGAGDGNSREVSTSTEQGNTSKTHVGDGGGSGGEGSSVEACVLPDSPTLLKYSKSQEPKEKKDLQCLATSLPPEMPSLTVQVKQAAQQFATETIDTSYVTEASTTMEEEQEGIGCKASTIVVSSSQATPRKRSEAAERAALAAEKRRKLKLGMDEEPCSSSSLFGTSTSQQVEAIEVEQEPQVECPLCYRHFSAKDIESHASDCLGQSSPPGQSSSLSSLNQVGQAANQDKQQASIAPSSSVSFQSATHRTLSRNKKDSAELRDLRVVLQRSPVAKRKHLEKASEEMKSTAKRNLASEQDIGSFVHSSRSFDQSARRKEKTLEPEPEKNTEDTQEAGTSQACSWLGPSSPEKKRPKWTLSIASSRGKSSKCSDNPFLGDYIPLNIQETSASGGGSTLTTSKAEERKARSNLKALESGSDSSDTDQLLAQYGAPHAARQGNVSCQVDIHEESDENEQALAQLANPKKKRPLSLSKTSRAKKSRTRTASDSEDIDDSFINCGMCNKRIPKACYDQHVDEELEERKRMQHVPRKVEVVTVKDRRSVTDREKQRRVEKRGNTRKHPSAPIAISMDAASEQDSEEIDWEEVSNSPIKCFQLTENIDSAVDYENQFAHLKEKKGRKRQSHDRGNPTRGNRGGYRGSYNRGFNRGYRSRKRRGSRRK